MYKMSVMRYVSFFICNDCYYRINNHHSYSCCNLLVLRRFTSFAMQFAVLRRPCDRRISAYADLGQMKLAPCLVYRSIPY